MSRHQHHAWHTANVIAEALQRARPRQVHCGDRAALDRWSAMDPPYDRSVRLREADRLEHPAPPGRVVVYEGRGDGTFASLSEACAGVYHLNSRAPRVLVAKAGSITPDVLARIRDAGFRGAVHDGLLTAPDLRSVLASDADLEIDLLRWLVRSNIASDPSVIADFAGLLLNRGGVTDGGSERERRSARGRFRNAEIAPPGRWLRAFWLVRLAVAIQHDPALTADRLAERWKFYDAAGLQRALREWFGCAFGTVQECLGWEWLLQAAIVRKTLSR